MMIISATVSSVLLSEETLQQIVYGKSEFTLGGDLSIFLLK